MNLMRVCRNYLQSLAKSLRYTKEAAYPLANENEDAVVENALQWLLNKERSKFLTFPAYVG